MLLVSVVYGEAAAREAPAGSEVDTVAPEPDGLIGVVDADGTYGSPAELLPNTTLTAFPEVAAIGIEYAVAVEERTPPLIVVSVKLDIGVTPKELEGAMLVGL